MALWSDPSALTPALHTAAERNSSQLPTRRLESKKSEHAPCAFTCFSLHVCAPSACVVCIGWAGGSECCVMPGCCCLVHAVRRVTTAGKNSTREEGGTTCAKACMCLLPFWLEHVPRSPLLPTHPHLFCLVSFHLWFTGGCAANSFRGPDVSNRPK